MPAARYTALPNERDDEMEAAFESDDDDRDDQATRPMLVHSTPTHRRSYSTATTTPGGYDFEQVYDYDYPPPGSPPRPSSTALPNDIGNSNGQMPSGPIWRPAEGGNMLQRGLRSLFPQGLYARLPTTGRARAIGGGLDNDGVFANVVAKPVNPARVQTTEDGVHVMPEEAQKDAPPSYAAAQADAVPPYWETTVHAPSSAVPGEMIVDGLPSGTLFSFLWNMLISLSFNFVGFLLTYLLHTTHAAKYGSRAGLGVTLLQYGFALRNRELEGPVQQEQWPWEIEQPADPLGSEPTPTPTTNSSLPASTLTPELNNPTMMPYPQEWIAFFLMTLGWFLLLTSFLSYWRVKRWEHQILQSAAQPTGESVERDRAVRRNLQHIFGVQFSTRPARAAPEAQPDLEAGRAAGGGEEHLSDEERRLRDDLRAAGLI
ncbi:hypothetical protein EXIGLDRAFT_614763 [Exidia glandulosa HHB12029]|uniref:Uncharacterized protein n=1 Tax=Exidia glandulosa HHB12029 TaxID=1314781 RepID=A0A165HLE5_EXIGL|nr:hypothetical protein EXIGLDRAFT_614763 [Exidia glandulosa HHB12029]